MFSEYSVNIAHQYLHTTPIFSVCFDQVIISAIRVFRVSGVTHLWRQTCTVDKILVFYLFFFVCVRFAFFFVRIISVRP